MGGSESAASIRVHPQDTRAGFDHTLERLARNENSRHIEARNNRAQRHGVFQSGCAPRRPSAPRDFVRMSSFPIRSFPRVQPTPPSAACPERTRWYSCNSHLVIASFEQTRRVILELVPHDTTLVGWVDAFRRPRRNRTPSCRRIPRRFPRCRAPASRKRRQGGPMARAQTTTHEHERRRRKDASCCPFVVAGHEYEDCVGHGQYANSARSLTWAANARACSQSGARLRGTMPVDERTVMLRTDNMNIPIAETGAAQAGNEGSAPVAMRMPALTIDNPKRHAVCRITLTRAFVRRETRRKRWHSTQAYRSSHAVSARRYDGGIYAKRYNIVDQVEECARFDVRLYCRACFPSQ